jgi:hypothetical protein
MAADQTTPSHQTPRQQDYAARTDHRRCPYCGAPTELIDSGEIFRRSYGWLWICRPCQAWVGCHQRSQTPLGSLADARLRELRKRAHAALDPLWRRGRGGRAADRTRVYQWLATELEIRLEDCHIGLFREDACQRVIELCEARRPR